jgi:hypothetical protein
MARQVTLVCGPPCAGKTTHVQQHAVEGDTVLDQDQIAQAIGSDREWLHSRTTSMRAHRRMRGAIVGVGNAQSGTAWVVRCQANGHRRRSLAFSLRATSVVVLKPPMDVVLERAQHRPDPIKTGRLIRDWYATYTPAACDITLDGFELECSGPA